MFSLVHMYKVHARSAGGFVLRLALVSLFYKGGEQNGLSVASLCLGCAPTVGTSHSRCAGRTASWLHGGERSTLANISRFELFATWPPPTQQSFSVGVWE